jgi:hypothetical protein
MADKTNTSLLINVGQGLSLMLGLPRINSWETKERPKKAIRGTFGFNSQTNSLEYYDGNDWFAASMQQA